MLLDRPPDLALLAIQVAEDQVNLERIAGGRRGLRQLLDRRIDLVGDQEVEAEDVVRRLARAPAIDPAAVLQLVALPRLADRQAEQQAEQARRRTTKLSISPARRTAGSTSSHSLLRAQHQLDQLADRAAAAADAC